MRSVQMRDAQRGFENSNVSRIIHLRRRHIAITVLGDQREKPLVTVVHHPNGLPNSAGRFAK
jgi:hypothetical protein